MNFLGIDLGTSSVKIVIMDEQGKIVNSISKEYPVYYPKPNWAEQNPEDWWNAVKEGIKELTEKCNMDPKDIKSIGFSGQMHGLVLLDEKNNVLRPALLWCDQRTEKQCHYLNKVIGQDKISKYTGNMALTGFTAPKILWVKENEPHIFNKVAHILLPKDYIRFKLTGEYATDVSDASGTLFFDVKHRKWSHEMLEILSIKEELLPKVYESWEVTGKVTSIAANDCNIKEGTIVVGGAGDQAAGAVGTGVTDKGTLSIALGTSGVVFACSDDYYVDEENRLHSFCHSNGKYHQMGVMLSAASCLKWWVEEANLLKSPKNFLEVLEEAESCNVGSNGLIFLPYLMGERTPYSDPNARGAFIGLNMTHTRGHMTRAVLEGVCFGLRDSLEILRSLNVPVKEVRVSGGGSKSKLWLQILADVLNVKVQLINAQEGPAYGASILAAVGAGVLPNVDEACRRFIKITEEVEPIKENVAYYDKLYEVYHSLYPVLKDTFSKISTL